MLRQVVHFGRGCVMAQNRRSFSDSSKVFRALILGAPGSGKGTMSSRLVKDFNCMHISSGDALRQQIKNGTVVGKEAEEYITAGALVPDVVITKLMMEHVRTLPTASSWLLDGFPRTIEQAKSLDAEFDINMVLDLDVPEAEIISRIGNRRVHVPSGRVYHLTWSPPKVENTDDETGEPLIQRPDDTEEAIAKRMQQYRKSTQPLIEHYQPKNVLKTFSGTQSNVIYPVIKSHVEGWLAK